MTSSPSAIAAWLGWLFDGLEVHLYTLVTPARMTKIQRKRGIRGLILHSLPESGGGLDLAWAHFVCVTKGLTVSHPAVRRVVSSHYEDMQLVLHELERRLYSRIGLVSSRLEQSAFGASGSGMAGGFSTAPKQDDRD
jgi:hypothetical protein